MAQPIALTSTQAQQFLNRNPGVANRVLEWNVLTSTLDWSQIQEAPWFLNWDFTVPGAIPADGINVTDSVWTNVLIAPDASGNLHYTGFAPANVGESVSGPTGLPSLPDIASTLMSALFVLGALFVVLEVKPWRN